MSRNESDSANAEQADALNCQQETLGLIMDVPVTGTIQTQTQAVQRCCENPACGKPIHPDPYEIKRGRGRFCSVSCGNAVRTGERNPGFKNWASRNNKRGYVNRFRSKYPEKARAHDAVKNALARGVLVRPAACQECGAVGKTDSHHEDYARPLDVQFVCRSCHRKLDEARRERLALLALQVYELVDLGYDTANGDADHHEGLAAPKSIDQISR